MFDKVHVTVNINVHVPKCHVPEFRVPEFHVPEERVPLAQEIDDRTWVLAWQEQVRTPNRKEVKEA